MFAFSAALVALDAERTLAKLRTAETPD